MFSKFEKMQIEKSRENLEKVLGKFYFKFKKFYFGTNCEKTGIFVNIIMKHNIKKSN